MSSRQLETTALAKAEPTPAQGLEAPEIAVESGRSPCVTMGTGGDPVAQAAALAQASGGRIERAGNALLQLQRSYGNRHVQQVVESAAPAPVIQTKLVLGPADDKYEREADRVAAQVTRGATQPVVGADSRTPAIQRLAGAEGGAVDASVQQAIQSARGGGQPLPEQVRGSMEQALGADFSGVRLHTDAQADQLNRSLRARAFTTGRDIFFRRGVYTPESRGGQELIAHELTHVVQQDGSAMTDMGALPDIIQRDIGFEFEAGDWEVFKLARNLSAREEIYGDISWQAVTNADKSWERKGTSFYDGLGFQATVDEIGAVRDLEFRTKAFKENDVAGLRQTLDTIVTRSRDFVTEATRRNGQQQYLWPERDLNLKPPPQSGGVWLLSNPAPDMQFQMQATAGIRLDRIANLMEAIGDQLQGEDPQATTRRQGGRNVLIEQSGKSEALALSAYASKEAIGDLLAAPYVQAHPNFDSFQKDGIAHLRGFLSLLGAYIYIGHEAPNNALSYPKAIAPLMARTDFAALFRQIPAPQQQLLKANDSEILRYAVGLVRDYMGLPGDLTKPIFSMSTFSQLPQADMFKDLTVEQWVRGIAEKGQDRFTKKGYKAWQMQQAGRGPLSQAQKTRVTHAEELESLGSMGSNMDTLAQALNVPIFEFRSIYDNLTGSNTVTPEAARDIALKLVTYVQRLNALEDKYFGEA